ncbi:MAG: hypothetical protein ACI8X3_003367, partial [Saprospiraceae bacterium]
AFEVLKPKESGFFARGNAKDIAMIKQSGNNYMIVVANNNSPLQFFRYNEAGPFQ